MKEESWVTIVSNDEEALQAFVLSRSLKHAFTTKSQTLLLTGSISHSLLECLEEEYDFVFNVNTHSLGNVNGYSKNSLSKIFCWNLKGFKRCAYLDSNTLVSCNVDEIFDLNHQFSSIPLPGTSSKQFDSSFYLFEPSLVVSRKLKRLAQLHEGNGDINKLLNIHFESKWNSLEQEQSGKNLFKRFLDLKNYDAAYELGIIHLPNASAVAGTKFNHAQQKITELWNNIFFNEILPRLKLSKDENLLSLLEEVKNKFGLALRTNATIDYQNPAPETFNDDKLESAIAVVGMSCRFPGANNLNEFWELLKEGRDPVRGFPMERPGFNTAQETDSTFEAGYLKCPIDEFDAKFFGISPREAPFVDPQQRILLEVIWESLENSNINPQSLRDSNTGVFLGIWQQDYAHLIPKDFGYNTNDMHHRYLGNAFSATASRISHFLGMFGPNYSIESGCSSSSAAVHLACESLKRGETNLTVACGVNLVLVVVDPFSDDSEHGSIILSKDHRCKTFDESANGFVRAEGCGSLVLKRYSDAIRDGDNIVGIIRGTALNNDGPGTSFGTPNAKAQERVYSEALKNAGVLPHEVSYVEAHGTGTAVGDPTEMFAIGQVYSKNRDPNHPLIVSSVKSCIGHAEACAGLAGIIKTLLCLKFKAIPPHLHLKNLNHRINLETIPAKIPVEFTEWAVGAKEARIAGVSSFSMSGTNVHVILQEPQNVPLKLKNQTSDKEFYEIIQISAKSEDALEQQRLNYIDYLKTCSANGLTLKDVAFASNVGRANLAFRISVIGKSIPQIVERLEKRSFVSGKAPTNKQNICFLFSGQGSQYFGMAKNLYENFEIFQMHFDFCNQEILDKLGVSLFDICWNNPALLEKSVYCQPAIFCIQYCLVEFWKYFGIMPNIVIGHSVGEFAASICSGAVSFQDAFTLVVERSKLVETLQPGAMLAVKSSSKIVAKGIEEFLKSSTGNPFFIDIAAVNSDEEVVISGSIEAVQAFDLFCINNGLKTQAIPASHAFHSKAMEPILEAFHSVAQTVLPSTSLNCAYISGTLGKPIGFEEFEPYYWVRHLRDTVRFSSAIKLAWEQSKIFIEIGASPILLGLAMANVAESIKGLYCPSLRKNEEDWSTVFTTLSKLYTSGGVDINWENWFGQRNKKAILPTYPFQRQKFWFDEIAGCGSNGMGMQLNTRLLHPLLGRQLPVSISDNIFSQALRLKDISYVSDHKVVERVILPAAAFLEGIIAGGKEALTPGSKMEVPFSIENFVVEAAMEIEESGAPCNIQTVVSSNSTDEKVEYNISINRQISLNEADKWKRHAIGNFNPTTDFKEIQTINIEIIKSALEKRNNIEAAYQKIADIGIQFGPKFQSISSAWTGKIDNTEQLLTEIHLPEDWENYTCHPIVIDGMIQSQAFSFVLSKTGEEIKEKDKNAKSIQELLLPISIRKFIWSAGKLTPKVYAFIPQLKSPNDSNQTVHLYNEHGECLASMIGLELISVSPKAFLQSLNVDKESLPYFLEEVWRPVTGIMRSRVLNLDKNLVVPEKSSYVEQEQIGDSDKTNSTFFLIFLRSIQECNWKWPVAGEKLLPKDWVEKVPAHFLSTTKMCIKFMVLLVNEGYLRKEDLENYSYRVVKPLPTIQDLNQKIQSFNSQDEDTIQDIMTYKFVRRAGFLFTNLLQGSLSPLDYMFPADPNEVGALRFYAESKVYDYNNGIASSLLLDSIRSITPEQGMLRILEVGAGGGKSTISLMDELDRLGANYHYTFTDIAPSFVAAAMKNPKLSSRKNISFGILNLEEDPMSQGFAPNQFDIVFASQVLHATKNLYETLTHINQLTRTGGAVVIAEMITTEYVIQFTFGFLDGWWRFNDFREFSPLANRTQWNDCLKSTGFTKTLDEVVLSGKCMGLIGQKTMEIAHHPLFEQPKKKQWIIFSDESKLDQMLTDRLSQTPNRKVKHVIFSKNVETWSKVSDSEIQLNPKNPENFTNFFNELKNSNEELEGMIYMATAMPESRTGSSVEESQEITTGGLLHACQAIAYYGSTLKIRPRITLVARGCYYIGDSEQGNPELSATWGLLKSFINEHREFYVNLIDTDPLQTDTEFESLEVYSRLWTKDNELFVAFRENKEFINRFVNMDKRIQVMSLPNSSRYEVKIPESGYFGDLETIVCSRGEVGDFEVEVAVEAAGLNFRDIFIILKPEGFNIPKNAQVGFDLSGVVSSVGSKVTKFKPGDEVFGISKEGGLRSHAILSEKALIRKPKSMTFTSAATIPCAFITVVISFCDVAKIHAGDRVLIHVASGGVGLAAIQVCQHFGAEIYATAGSRRKRAYLRKVLGLKNVYHSRNTSYADEILRDTNGAGVTVVLNSLTNPGFKEATLRTCADGARFVEIAKMNIWSEEEVKELRPDVYYKIVELSDMADDDVDKVSGYIRHIEEEFDNETYSGLPHRTYPLELLKEAFFYFRKARHIGKVVIKIPKAELSQRGKFKFVHEQFSKESTYIITGGLGGIGLEVTKWMASSGAKNIVLIGRSMPDCKTMKVISGLYKEHSGLRIEVMQCDVAEKTQVENTFSMIEKLRLPPIRGIMHAAGVISDSLVINQNWEKFTATFRPKVYGALNLHNLTLGWDLEFFTMFSSGVTILGVPGQSNHSAANGFLDNLTHYRISMGLPGNTINWGAWGEVGLAVHAKFVMEGGYGLKPFSTRQGIASIDKIFRENLEQAAVFDISDWTVTKQFIKLGNILDELKSDGGKPQGLSSENLAMIEEIKKTAPEERQEKIEKFMEIVIKQTLRIPECDKLDHDQDFSEIGVDSLMGMEMRNQLQGLLGDKTLTVSAVQENRTIRKLSTHIATLMNSDDEAVEIETMSVEEYLKIDTVLPDDIVPCLSPENALIQPSQFRKILLTGATGHLGIHFIPELLAKNKEIFCLVRAKSNEDAKSRLLKTLERYSLIENIDVEKLRILAGDVKEDHLGLDLETYELISNEIDAVVHCAIKNNHLENYGDGGENSMRKHNTGGLLNVLRFCGAKKTKHLLHASSVVAITRLDSNGEPIEDFPESTSEAKEITNGYALSKFICEYLLKEAKSRGFPVSVFRYSGLFGSSQTGYLPSGYNHGWNIILSCIRIRKFPAIARSGFPAMAVDNVAKISAEIFLNDNSEGGVYNVTFEEPATQETLIEVFQEIGIEAEFIPASEWRDLVFEEFDKSELGPVAYMYEDDSNAKVRGFNIHPMAQKLFTETDQMSKFNFNIISPKVQKDFPDVRSHIISTKRLLRKHLDTYYNSLPNTNTN